MFTRSPSLRLAVAFLAAAVVSPSAIAQGNTASPASDGQVLQRVDGKLDRVLENSEQERRAYVDQPLGERKNGIEFNFFRPLLWDEGERTLSGTYSRFDTDSNVEIAVPVMYSAGDQDDGYFINGQPRNADELRSVTVDVHYRQYLGHRLDGFYLSGFTRVAHLDGSLNYDYMNDRFQSARETKMGVGVGLGYRIISRSGLYWGMSVNLGRYFVGDSDIFEDSDSLSANLDDEEVIFDIEFFKFGYAF